MGDIEEEKEGGPFDWESTGEEKLEWGEQERRYTIKEGKNLTQAINLGLQELGLKKEEVDIEILEVPAQEGGLYKVKLSEKKLLEDLTGIGEHEFLKYTLSADESAAYVSFTLPEDLTIPVPHLTPEEVMQDLKAHRITYGIKPEVVEEVVKYLAQGREFSDLLIAQGISPEQGRDAQIEHKIDLTPTVGKIDEETGKIDFRERDYIKSVNEGDVLAIKIPATGGVPGQSVTGKIIKPTKGRDQRLVAGKNVEVKTDTEGRQLFVATINGRPTLLVNKIEVDPVTMIDSDVDYSVGNLNVKGTLRINGRVASGFKVRAENDIYIQDAVESAFIEAGGDIYLMQGVKGQGKGFIRAKGNINATYLERANVEAEGDINVGNAILESKVACGGKLVATSGRGSIIGGEIRATRGIEAKKVGSDFSVSTVLIVGTDFMAERELKRIEEQIGEARGSADKIEKNLGRDLLTSSDLSKYPPSIRPRLKKLIEVWEKLNGQLKNLNERKYQLLERKKGAIKSKIRVLDTIYPRVDLKVGDSRYTTEKEIRNVLFYEDVEKHEVKYSLR